ncbi:adenosylmethionine--8-amino-7-oxononanoate transaminase [Buchnera aphidicola]|uniref:Adenosylmethionine-8-amino-7-oxononanoate aminotransferase n=1 Tax=Buchnera aphidicola (Therioaphis trifolii) TaxID=1241884 RepID=A0A4D6YB90_9GAMM|nr:adenosylmethionine--8-amino-7-oxononanoate transaminase [Buchnera aphidicola]QCI27197.1 adenosylmethionine--8-amino-7-oxononanoate transaminase [Buchnera aphidicola (Therioaphis trifolii)]
MKKNYLVFNSQHIWHPYDSITNPLPCYLVSSAKGINFKLNSGLNIIDGMSSWWAIIHGYNHPLLNKTLINQSKKISHIMFGGITHYPAIFLCNELLKILPKKLNNIFLCDSGSVSIEIAMKMALQYCNLKKNNKTMFLTIRNGYHGDTFSAISVCDPKNSMHKLYNKIIPKYLFAKQPKLSFKEKWNNYDIYSFINIILKNKFKIIAVIVEPIVQGIGNMTFYHPEYLKQIRLLCNMYNILLIIDEIATGFGRTGKMFAYQYANIIPDILCIGKSLTGGMMTLAATITTKEIAIKISNNYPYKIMHGPTFMGNPLSCSVAKKNISLLRKNIWKKQINYIEQYFKKKLFFLLKHPRISKIRILGAIAVIECYNFINLKLIQKFFINYGVWIRPYKKIIYLTPPYIIKKFHLNKLIKSITYAIKDNSLFFF